MCAADGSPVQWEQDGLCIPETSFASLSHTGHSVCDDAKPSVLLGSETGSGERRELSSKLGGLWMQLLTREGRSIILMLLQLFLCNFIFLFYRLKFVKVSEISFLKGYWIQILLGITLLWCDTVTAIKPADTLQLCDKAEVDYNDCLPHPLG